MAPTKQSEGENLVEKEKIRLINVSSKKLRKKTKRKKFKKVNSEISQEINSNSKSEKWCTSNNGNVMKYARGKPANSSEIKMKIEQNKIAHREQKIKYGLQQSARAEILLTEDNGYLEPDEDEISTQFTQKNIKDAVDPLSATKGFDLNLKFGPYRMNYTRNGRYLLLGGRRGHVAALDWMSKKLLCEMNVMEETYDVAWFHQETLFAVAQKKWVYVYDNQGIEIHCIKRLNNIYRMLFLPYHFLLACVGSKGFISWLDVSVGKIVEQFPTFVQGTASSITLHPGNAMVCLGESNGTVSFWGPNSKKPAITKWCHKQPICGVAFDPKGTIFTTAAIGGKVKIWDARNLNGPLEHYFLRSAPKSIAISHKGTIAFGCGNIVEVFNDKIVHGISQREMYLRHKVSHTINNMEFCPFEDVLGVAHTTGFCSMLVPGCGEANYDALEVNPLQTKSQRKEAEVKALLGKIPADLITWNPNELLKVAQPSRKEIVEAKKQLTNIKAPDMKFTPRKRTGKRKGSVKTVQRKKIMKEDFRRNYVKEVKKLINHESKETSSRGEEKTDSPVNSVLSRFKKG